MSLLKEKYLSDRTINGVFFKGTKDIRLVTLKLQNHHHPLPVFPSLVA